MATITTNSEMLISAANELSSLITIFNNNLKKRIVSTDLDEPDYLDYQTCQELLDLSKEIEC